MSFRLSGQLAQRFTHPNGSMMSRAYQYSTSPHRSSHTHRTQACASRSRCCPQPFLSPITHVLLSLITLHHRTKRECTFRFACCFSESLCEFLPTPPREINLANTRTKQRRVRGLDSLVRNHHRFSPLMLSIRYKIPGVRKHRLAPKFFHHSIDCPTLG